MPARQIRTLSDLPKLKRAPSTAMERRLHVWWSAILNKKPESIEVGDSFFQHGGDSIAAIRLVAIARVEKLCLTVSAIFSHPRLVDMALRITTEGQEYSTISPFALLGDVHGAAKKRMAVEQCGTSIELLDDMYPCSALQEGLMALSVRKSGAYVAQIVIPLSHPFQIDRFRTSWEQLVAFTPVLRTRLVHLENHGTFQVVLNEAVLWKHATDLESYLQADNQSPVQYGSPLSRSAIIKGTATSHSYFVWSAHHSLFDAWSLRVMFERVQGLYIGSTPLPVCPPFTSFLQYLGERPQGETESYWRSELDGATRMNFPALPSAAYEPHADGRWVHHVTLSRNTASEITTSTIMQGAWALLLSRYSGLSDITIGMVRSGRDIPLADVDMIIGPLMTTVPVRMQTGKSEQKAIDFLMEIQKSAIQRIPYEHAGLQSIKHLGPSQRAACGFEFLLVIQSEQSRVDARKDAPGIEWEVRDSSNFHTYALTVECILEPGSVSLQASFDTKVIHKVQMQRMLYQIEHVLHQLCAKDDIKLKAIELVSHADKQELWSWNREVPTATEACVHDLVEKQACSRPQAVAVDAWDGIFTHDTLNTLATNFAHELRRNGVIQGDLVPVALSKSKWAVVAQLGILKAGGGVLPIDLTHPVDRIAMIMEDACVRFIVSTHAHSHLYERSGRTVVLVGPENTLANTAVCSLELTSSSSAAFIFFTSGSTGRPKAIVIHHSAFCSSATAHAHALRLKSSSRVLQFASYTYDVSVGEMFTTLMTGGCVCIPSEEQRMNDLTQFIQQKRCNWAFFTPTVAALLRPVDVPSLKTVVLGGEHATIYNFRSWADKVHLINSYGPAETSIWSNCNGGVAADTDPANIGKAMSSTLLWVTEPDDHEKLAPIGCVGELCIEGPALSNGYLNDKTKTDAAFIVNPLWLIDLGSTTPTSRRIYKTGDLARYNGDGTINIVGRKDSQTKIRGQRVELGEVEHHLKKNLQAAEDVAVCMITPKGKDTTAVMAAFVCFGREYQEGPDGISLATREMLGRFVEDVEVPLTRSLPTYMHPSEYIPLGRMPITSGGKTDRNKLRAIGSTYSTEELLALRSDSAERKEPVTDIEIGLRRLWSSVLGVEESALSLEDDFFRQRGDSIAAMRLVASARSAGLCLTVADIFSSPLLVDMAKVASRLQENQMTLIKPFALLTDSEVVPILLDEAAKQCTTSRSSIQDVYPATALQEGLMALSMKVEHWLKLTASNVANCALGTRSVCRSS